MLRKGVLGFGLILFVAGIIIAAAASVPGGAAVTVLGLITSIAGAVSTPRTTRKSYVQQ